MNRLEQEKITVRRMIAIYCRKKEHNEKLCANCSELLEYASKRLESCPFGENKPACKKCKIHCYESDMRCRMKEIMRFSGPLMLWHYPLDLTLHTFRKN